MCALTTHLLADHFANTSDQIAIPCRRHSYACWKHSGADRHVTVGSFFGYKERNAQPCVLDHVFLQCVSGHGGKAWIKAIVKGLACPWVGAVDGPQHSGTALCYQVAQCV